MTVQRFADEALGSRQVAVFAEELDRVARSVDGAAEIRVPT